jgi:hypothetical protein
MAEGTWMQRAARPGTGERGAGTAAVQAGSASGQRGAKGQPVGGRSSEGGAPGMVARRLPRIPGWTVAPSRPRG